MAPRKPRAALPGARRARAQAPAKAPAKPRKKGGSINLVSFGDVAEAPAEPRKPSYASPSASGLGARALPDLGTPAAVFSHLSMDGLALQLAELRVHQLGITFSMKSWHVRCAYLASATGGDQLCTCWGTSSEADGPVPAIAQALRLVREEIAHAKRRRRKPEPAPEPHGGGL